MQKFLQELKKWELPADKYVIYGSGPLAVRGIREMNDMDVIVKDDLYQELKEKLGEKEEGKIIIHNGEIEIYPTWNALAEDADGMIDRAEIIQGFKFATLEDIMNWKRSMGRSKDKEDIESIKEFLAKSE
jgi:hypothetical protein